MRRSGLIAQRFALAPPEETRLVTNRGRKAAAASHGDLDADDTTLVDRLRRHDEVAFTALVDRYHAQLVRLATSYVPNPAIAEEVAQETWIGVFRGIDRFEGRSLFRTWLFRILVNQAKRRGERESRTVPFAALSPREDDDDLPEVAPDRFHPAGHRWAGHWAMLPQDLREAPEERLLSDETRAVVQRAIEALPRNQRLVISMRDVDGLAPEEICSILSISETNQRVLLHRARSKVRGQLERYLEGG
jgi:RNA polymerase sigma-70 factor (ECF subfamily)